MLNSEFKEKATSSDFLQQRIQLNRNSLKDYDEWSISVFPKIPVKSKVFDLGCGTGKQINLFSQFMSSESIIHALDFSLESLSKLKEEYKNKPHLKLFHSKFEDINDLIDGFKLNINSYNLIYSFYALYYTTNLEDTIKQINKLLVDGGIFWVVVPFGNTNVELFQIIEKYYKLPDKVVYSINNFHQDIINISIENGFNEYEFHVLNNKISYTSSEQLSKYYKNTTFFNPEFEQEVLKDIENIFTGNQKFQLSKEVLSLKFYK